ncbi:prenyltransferase/squalene oxidase repeat-containing protein [Amycolatopsis sp. NPDC049868]|uniref:prenyltransferase/squalene oxidase repeat-containing protein n=1 Tax=Amycolatopsis sp. NPDC049868 TaxID=3363934 RepID=UPI0037BE1BC9
MSTTYTPNRAGKRSSIGAERQLARLLDRNQMTLPELVIDALEYLRSCRLPDGSIAEDPASLVFHNWDSVNALKAFALWQDTVGFKDEAVVSGILRFLHSCEAPNGMIHSGIPDIGPASYCTETSGEYIDTLARLGLREAAWQRADFLRSQQHRKGNWDLVDPRVPPGFQSMPSVTAFALIALLASEAKPDSLDDALTFLTRSQKPAGDFGANRFYYNSIWYVVRPVTIVLARFGYHPQVAAVRDLVRRRQQPDGSWSGAESDSMAVTVSAELETAWALETLVHAGLTAADSSVRRGLSWLLGRRRPNGSWYGGRYPFPAAPGYPDVRAPQDVCATSQVLTVLFHITNVEESHGIR